jgi:hypothetical protein
LGCSDVYGFIFAVRFEWDEEESRLRKSELAWEDAKEDHQRGRGKLTGEVEIACGDFLDELSF